MLVADFEAVIFDLDGLVLDTESGFFDAWRKAAAAMGHDLSDAFCNALSGLNGADVLLRLQMHCGPELDLDRFAQLSRHFWLLQVEQQPIPVKSGVDRLLQLLNRHAVPFALATNSRRADALFCLANAGLETVFRLLICRDDVVLGKPAPDLVLQAADMLGVKVSRCLVLEDSPIGVTAALAAGAACAFVPSRLPADRETCGIANWVMDDLNQVAEFIAAHIRPSL